METTESARQVILVFLPAFAVLWCVFSWLIGRIGKWSFLAEKYPATLKPNGQFYHFRSAGIGLANYGNCLTVGVTSRGLYFDIFFLFKPGHKPILIPWNQIKFLKKMFFKRVKLQIGEPKIVDVDVSVKIFEEAKRKGFL